MNEFLRQAHLHAEDAHMQSQPVERAGRCLERREGYESKRSRLVGGLDVSVDTMHCTYFDGGHVR